MASANVSITRSNGTSVNISGTISDELASHLAHLVTEAMTASLDEGTTP